MTRDIRFLREALDDVLETQRWYASRQNGLDEDFGRELAAAMERVSLSPVSFPSDMGPVKRVVFRRFPYAIYFRVDGNEFLVVAVQGRQNPQRWPPRLL